MAAKIIKPRGTRRYRTIAADTRIVDRTTARKTDPKSDRTTSAYSEGRKAA